MKVALKDSKQLSKLVEESEKPILLFICKKHLATRVLISPILKDLRFKYQKKISFYDIRGDAHLYLEKQYIIHRCPTFLFFKNGKLVHKMEGLVNRLKLFNSVHEFLVEIKCPAK